MKPSLSTNNDNVFLSSGQALREKRVSIVFTLIFQSLLFLMVAFGIYGWGVSAQFKFAMKQQADAVAQSLLIQTAERATELLAIDDKLGINILLGSLAKNPLVADVTIYDEKGQELFKAGLKQVSHDNNGGVYRETLVIQKEAKGELQLRLNKQQFQLPLVVSVERAIIIAGFLLLVTLLFLFKLGRKITLPLIQLREWLRDPIMPVPAVTRFDEVGDLARDLQAKLMTSEQIEAYFAQFNGKESDNTDDIDSTTEVVSTESSDELTFSNFDQSFLQEIASFKTEETPAVDINESNNDVKDMIEDAETVVTQTAVLFVRLGGQEKLRLLPKERLINVLQRYRDCLGQAVRLYNGEIHTLSDGSSLVLFHGRGSQAELYLTHAICCGELMRGFSHELQVELADTNITSLLQIALVQGTELLGLTPQELLDNETVAMAKMLANNSRNLLLIDQSIAVNQQVMKLARVRALVSPEHTYCIERVLDPYAETLEKQLRNIRSSC